MGTCFCIMWCSLIMSYISQSHMRTPAAALLAILALYQQQDEP